MNRDRLIARLKADEGFSPAAFWDNDQWTFGYGCKAPCEGATISEPDATVLLGMEADEAIGYFEQMFGSVPMNDVRSEALTNMIFNLGPTKLRRFRKMIVAIHMEDWLEAAYQAQESLWFQQVGNRARRIVKEIETGDAELL